MRKWLTKDQFIERSNTLYKNKYDYSEVVYVNSKTPVKVLCPDHGMFIIKPISHLNKSECNECKKEDKRCSLLKNFIEKSTSVHKGKYNYSKVKYIDNKTKVCISCPNHGDFWQIPKDHKKGKGCRLCGYESINLFHRINNHNDFIKRMEEMYGNRFSFDKSKYISSLTKVIVTCPKHGDFMKTPNSLLSGTNCPKCSELCVYKYNVKTNNYFIAKSKEIWGQDSFGYSKVEYKNAKSEVILICRKHNIEFLQKPQHHYNKHNACPKCLLENKGVNERNYWTYERCYKTAKAYQWVSDFSKEQSSCYTICLRNKWFEDFTWLQRNYNIDENVITARKHLIYKYEFTEYKSVYIGLTLNLEQRHRGHLSKRYNSSVKEFCEEKGMKTPKPIIIEENLTLNEAKEQECYWIEHYRDLGYNILNKIKGGGVGTLCVVKTGNETETFISKAREIHGNNYDYSKVVYKNNSTKVCIICSEHGEFYQRPTDHINKRRGCQLCRKRKRV